MPSPTFRTTFALIATVVGLAVAGEWFLAAVYGEDEVGCTVGSFPVPLPDVPEASGIAHSARTANLFWTMNDSGAPTLYGVTADGQVTSKVKVPGAEVRNWEDLSVGPCPSGSCIYVADIGDNRTDRQTVRIYRLPEPGARDHAARSPDVFEGKYPDGPHDAEGAFVLPDGRLFIVTKDKFAHVYRFPLEAGQVTTLERTAMLPLNNVTDADASPDGTRVAVRTRQDVVFYRTSELLRGDVEHGVAVSTGDVGEPQGEGVAFGAGGQVLLAGEGGGDRNAPRPGTLATLQCRLESQARRR